MSIRTENIFEMATRNKYRFPYKGMISVEDLWDLNQTQLDSIYKALNKEHTLLDVSSFDHEHRQVPGYNEAKAKTFSDARVTFTEEQVRKETARCLGCGATKVDEYLCIGCGLCTTKCKFDAIKLKKVRNIHAGTFETMPIKVAEGLVKRTGGIIKKAVTK